MSEWGEQITLKVDGKTYTIRALNKEARNTIMKWAAADDNTEAYSQHILAVARLSPWQYSITEEAADVHP